MPNSALVDQLILQFPVVAILLWLLFRLDRRMADLIEVICELALQQEDKAIKERVSRYLDNSQTKF